LEYDEDMSDKSQTVVRIVGTLVIVVSACSRSPQEGKATQVASLNDLPTAYKLYNASPLVEIRDLGDAPESLRTELRGDMVRGGEGPGGRCCEFILGGVSPTSVIIAFELFGYVPSYRAMAFVHTNSGWSEAGQWNIGAVNSLQELKEMTNRPPDFWGNAR
jgi:hypothetical protein